MENKNFEGAMESVNLTDPVHLQESVWNYLKPHKKTAPRAHLLTINGLTYPAHKIFGFAAVPDPHEIVQKGNKFTINIPRSKRRYSMLAYLHSLRPGDLLFFFQADPQWPRDIFNRRGFRGIWIVASTPFRDTTNIKLPTGYEILGACPNCQTPFNFGAGTLNKGKECGICKKNYGMVTVNTSCGKKTFSRVVLSARILIKPLIVFKKTSGDNRVYGDMGVEPLIWISRTDNAMGAGKGSTIRTLLPEEASKIAYMLATEDMQGIDRNVCIQKYPGNAISPIKDHNGVEVKYPRLKRQHQQFILEHEFHLNLYFALNIDQRNNQLQRILNINLDEVDYWTTEFPWGYTGDTSDFVLSCWDKEKGRYKVYLFEFKKDDINKATLAEILLYTPWVARVLTQFRHETTEVEIIPVMIGRKCKLSALPSRYNLKLPIFVENKVKLLKVNTPIVLECEPLNVFSVNGVYYANDLNFNRVQLPIRSFTPPPLTYTTSEVEKNFISRKYLKIF